MDIKKDRMAYRLKINYAEAEPDYPGFLRGTDLIDLYTYTKKATKSQVSSLIRKFEIAHYINKKAGAYSSGMSKKLSLLLAFIGSPELILLDEPFITLDPQALNIVENLIAEYHKAGAAFIIASHQHFAFSDPLYATTTSLVNKTISFE
jgi:ABC-2 type transport system ATP-binding protein